jgi:hypothetical protein
MCAQEYRKKMLVCDSERRSDKRWYLDRVKYFLQALLESFSPLMLLKGTTSSFKESRGSVFCANYCLDIEKNTLHLPALEVPWAARIERGRRACNSQPARVVVKQHLELGEVS